MRSWKSARAWGWAVILAVVVAGACSKKSTSPQTSAAEETDAGWEEFAAGSYTAARSHFLTAISRNDGYADAYNGLGWSQAFLDNLGAAVTAFTNALDNALTTPDADAGLAVVYRELPDYPGAVTHAQAVLAADAAYVFSRMTSVDHNDMTLIMAQAYYRQGEGFFAAAQTQLNILVPGNGLNPASPATWVVNGVTYGTYAEALLMALESAAASFGPP